MPIAFHGLMRVSALLVAGGVAAFASFKWQAELPWWAATSVKRGCLRKMCVLNYDHHLMRRADVFRA
jgi:hypothetical protein